MQSTDRALTDAARRSNDHYADIGIMAIMPRAGLCRMFSADGDNPRHFSRSVRHNLAPSSSVRPRQGSNNKEALDDDAYEYSD